MVFVIWSIDTNQCHSFCQTIPGDTGRQTSHSHWYMCRVHRIPGLGIRWRLMKNKVWSMTIHTIVIMYPSYTCTNHVLQYHQASNIVYTSFNWYSRYQFLSNIFCITSNGKYRTCFAFLTSESGRACAEKCSRAIETSTAIQTRIR